MNVITGPLLPRAGEHPGGRIEFDEFTKIHEGRKVGHSGRLLNVVGHDRERVIDLEILD